MPTLGGGSLAARSSVVTSCTLSVWRPTNVGVPARSEFDHDDAAIDRRGLRVHAECEPQIG